MPTNFVRGSYQEIIDLQTVPDKVSVIGLHTPTGGSPYKFFKPFFDAYKQYHYDGMSISLVPAATLPADIAQVSLMAGEPNIDSRDILNPIMFKGCHGEDMGIILNQMLNGPAPDAPASLDFLERKFTESLELSEGRSNFFMGKELERLYYKALTDKTWAKAHPQRGFRKGGMHPLVYDLATNVSMPTGTSLRRQSNANTVGALTVQGQEHNTTSRGGALGLTEGGNLGGRFPMGDFGITSEDTTTGRITVDSIPTRNGLQFFTPRMRGLGWLDTRVRFHTAIYNQHQSTGDDETWDAVWDQQIASANATHVVNRLPLLYMGICLLPPAYKATQSFRLIINHRFSWRGFRPISLDDPETGVDLDDAIEDYQLPYFNWIGKSEAKFPIGNSVDPKGDDDGKSVPDDM